eukprot:UN10239
MTNALERLEQFKHHQQYDYGFAGQIETDVLSTTNIQLINLLQNVIIVTDSIDVLLADCSIISNIGRYEYVVNVVGIAKALYHF